MKTKLIIHLSILLLLNCGNLIGDDPQLKLDKNDLKGEWVRITEIPSDIPGLYKKDTVIYQIGLEDLTSYIKFVDKSIIDPLTFKIVYPKGGFKYGYLHDRNEEYDWDNETSYLMYTLELGLPQETTKYQATFLVPKNFNADTLCVTIDSEIFGLKKRKDF